MGLWENFKNLVNVSPDDEFDGEDFETEEEQTSYTSFDEEPVRKPEREAKIFRNEKKVVSYSAPASQMQVVLVRPERFEDVPSIADHLNAKKTVVLNLESADRDVSRRIIDFLSGVAYANRGSIKKVANSTFIIVPVSVDVSGELMFDELDASKIYY